eukprot:jgi/Ulvmu1/6484/UM003_0115.1
MCPSTTTATIPSYVFWFFVLVNHHHIDLQITSLIARSCASGSQQLCNPEGQPATSPLANPHRSLCSGCGLIRCPSTVLHSSVNMSPTFTHRHDLPTCFKRAA